MNNEDNRHAENASEIKTLKRQIADCMEFLIWLKGYNQKDAYIEAMLNDVLVRLSISQDKQ